MSQGVDARWQVVVWNDPVNLMSYVAWVFRSIFGLTRPAATSLMLKAHAEGSVVVEIAPREQAEMTAFRLLHHGLRTTLEPL